ncbi:MAG: carboxypeptidase regulatory-like domain-containing protein [Planctomycetes bacterium]|nr:carboxypeptidase regulatory-like domain-containing protein [Planctomycetota bacterium]
MASRSTVVGIVALVALVVMGVIAFLFLGEQPDRTTSTGVSGADEGASSELGAAASAAEGAAQGPAAANSGSGERAQGIELSGAAAEEIGERVGVRGRLLLADSGQPPTNARVTVLTGQTHLDYWPTAQRLGGRLELERIEREGSLAQKVVSAGGWKATCEVAANADGTFEVQVPKKAPRFSLYIEADFACVAAPRWYHLGSKEVQAGLEIALRPAAEIQVEAVDAAGKAIAGVLVGSEETQTWYIGVQTPRPRRLLEVNSKGLLRLRSLSTRAAWVYGIADGYALARESVTSLKPGEVTPVRMQLAPEIPLEVRAVDEKGDALPGARVRLFPDGRGFGQLPFGVVQTDAAGRGRLSSLGPGKYKVSARSDGMQLSSGPTQITLPLDASAQPPVFTFARGHSISGIVVDSAKRPVVGVRVSAHNAEEEKPQALVPGAPPRPLLVQEVVTGPQGQFRLSGLTASPQTIRVAMEKRSRATKTPVPVDSENIEIVLPDPTGLAGTVVDAATGEAIRAFVVSVVSADDYATNANYPKERQVPYLTDDGKFEILGLDPKHYRFEVASDGFELFLSEDVEVKQGQIQGDLVARLMGGASIVGKVVDAATGAPVRDARVEVVSQESEDGPPGRMPGPAAVRADGSFEFRGVPAGKVRVYASHELLTEAASALLDTAPGARIEIPLLVLKSGGSAIGTVLDDAGKPVTQGLVYANLTEAAEPSPSLRNGWRQTSLDSQGSFRLDGLIPGTWSVTAIPQREGTGSNVASRQHSGKVVIVEGRTSQVDFQARKGGGVDVTVRVTQKGAPISGTTVMLSIYRTAEGESAQENFASNATTNDQGEAVFQNVQPGRGTVSSHAWAAGSSSGFSRDVEISSEPKQKIEFELPMGGSIRGRVTRASDGTAVAGLMLTCWSHDPTRPGMNSNAQATTDRDGRYEFLAVLPGNVTVNTQLDGGYRDRSSSEFKGLTNKTATVSVVEGGVATLDLALESGSTVLVEVLDPSGNPVNGAWVNINPQNQDGTNENGQNASGQTNGAGLARVSGVSRGMAIAYVQREGFPPAQSEPFIVAEGSDTRITVRLRPGSRILLVLRAPDGSVLQPDYVLLQGPNGLHAPGWETDDSDGVRATKLFAEPAEYQGTAYVNGFEPITFKVSVPDAQPRRIDIRADSLKKSGDGNK